jgi:O-antigen ligase
MTVTRAMLLAYAAGGTLVVWQLASRGVNRRQRRRMVRIIAVLAIAFIVLALPFAESWLGRIDPESVGDVATILGRLDEYAAFVEGFLDSPIFGRGLGHSFIYPSLFDLTLSEVGITVCHNHFFFLAGTTGLVGIALYYSVFVVGMVRHWRVANGTSLGRETQGYVIGSLGAALAGMLFTLSSTTFTTLSYNLFLAIFLHTAQVDWSAR